MTIEKTKEKSAANKGATIDANGAKFKVFAPSSLSILKAVPENLKSVVPENSIYFEGFASTVDKDRHQDIVISDFWTDETIAKFMVNPVLLFQHDQSNAVGKIVQAEKRDEGLFVRGFVSKSWADAWRVEEGIIKSLSVWLWVDWDDIDYDYKSETWIMKSGELLEVSLVSIPANPSATFSVEKSLGSDFDNFKFYFSNKNLSSMKTFKFKNIGDFVKNLIPKLNLKLGLDLNEDSTDEDILKAVEDAKSVEDVKKELETQLTDSITKSVTENITNKLKEVGIDFETINGSSATPKAATDANAAEEVTEEAPNQMTQMFELMKEMKGLVEKSNGEKEAAQTELARMKGANGNGGKVNGGAAQVSATVEQFQNSMKSIKPLGNSKY